MRFTRSGRQLLYVGRPVNLAGILAGVGDRATSDSLDPPFDDDFARMTQHENNFHRHWVIAYWTFSPPQKPEAMRRRNSVFQRTFHPKDETGVWLLMQYNTDYITRLQAMIAKAAAVGVVVQLVLFDRCGLDVTGSGGRESWTLPGTTQSFPVRRWDDSPWNVQNNDQPVLQGTNKGTPDQPKYSGLPEFFLEDKALRNLQRAYIEQVVNATKGYWNVFYEIMNEPQGQPTDAHVRWADWVVGVIHGLTGGNSIIFYNDHNTTDGADVNLWKDLKLPNYGNFHGVSFHRVPTSIDPNAPNAGSKFKFLNEKIFQVSTDGNSGATRDTQAANEAWTNYAFSRGMIFQAQSISPDAARGIQQHHPTPLK
jgi:hypothetical protein